tara:strand:+ start:1963 stop:2556 length:594 start_codon:yes stop_codon:yes gene_type:complete
MSKTKNNGLTDDDVGFNGIYLNKYRDDENLHWTPITVIKKAILWLNCSSESNVLDIGSGVGKFCIIGSLISKGKFTGVEKREDLIKESNRIKKHLNLKDISFNHRNITEINFQDYSAFYFYNPFCDHQIGFNQIDNKLNLSKKKSELYENYVRQQLDLMPKGTRIVTYYSEYFELPTSYFAKDIAFKGTLVLWEKKT